jgi:hypothetical protein
MKNRALMVSFLIFLASLVPRLPAETASQSTPQKPPQEIVFQEVINASLIIPRSEQDIGAALERAKQEGEAADRRTAAAQAESDKAAQLLQQQKSEVAALKKKIDQVKKEKQQIDRITLEAEKKKADLVQDFLEKYRSFAEAAIDGARSERDLAQALVAAFEAELELSQKREARDRAVEAEFAAASLAVSVAQEKALRLFKIAADKNKGVADKLSDIENKRMDLFQIRARLVTGVR